MRQGFASLALVLFALKGAPACAVEPTASDETGESGETTGTNPDPSLCAPVHVLTDRVPGARTLELIATRDQIPGLADQPTTRGQRLGALAAFDGRLHLGYGDYSDNTGPIAMHAWDPATGAWVDLGVLPTEEVQRLVPGEGTLYVPATDPDGHQESGGLYRLDCAADQWTVTTPIEGAVHVYDVAVQGDQIFAGTGSLTGAPALLMASSDHGDTWTEVLRRESEAERFSRFYYVGATPDLLFVSGRDHPDPGTDFAWSRQGDGAFTPIADPPTGSLVPIVIGQELIVSVFSGDPGSSAHTADYRIIDGALTPATPWPQDSANPLELVDWTPTDRAGERVLVMREPDLSLRVFYGDEATSAAWSELTPPDGILAPPDDEYISAALLLNDLYLGTRRGSLYRVREFWSLD